MKISLKNKKGAEIVSVNPLTVAATAVGCGIVAGKVVGKGLSKLVSSVPRLSIERDKPAAEELSEELTEPTEEESNA